MPVAETLGAELGWDADRIASEAEAWLADKEADGIDPALAAG
jgi:hypothetical protein